MQKHGGGYVISSNLLNPNLGYFGTQVISQLNLSHLQVHQPKFTNLHVSLFYLELSWHVNPKLPGTSSVTFSEIYHHVAGQNEDAN